MAYALNECQLLNILKLNLNIFEKQKVSKVSHEFKTKHCESNFYV